MLQHTAITILLHLNQSLKLSLSLYIDAVVLASGAHLILMSPLLLQLPGGAARPHLLMSPPLLPLPEGAVLHLLMMSPPLLPLPGGAVLHLLRPQLHQLPGGVVTHRPHLLLNLSPPGGAVPHLLPRHPLIPGG